MKRRYLLSFFFVPGILMAHPFKQGNIVMDVRKNDISEGTDIIMYSPHGGVIRISFMKMEILSWHQIRTIVWM